MKTKVNGVEIKVVRIGDRVDHVELSRGGLTNCAGRVTEGRFKGEWNIYCAIREGSSFPAFHNGGADSYIKHIVNEPFKSAIEELVEQAT